jgi:hypothetical protein
MNHHNKLPLMRWSPANFLPGLAMNLDHPNVYLPSNWDYKHEPTLPAQKK